MKIDERTKEYILSSDEYHNELRTHNRMSDETKQEFKHITEMFTLKLSNLEKLIMIEFKDLKEKINTTIDNGDKTNGSVSSLKKWRYITTGGLIVLVFFVGLFGYIYNINNDYLGEKIIANKEQIDKIEILVDNIQK